MEDILGLPRFPSSGESCKKMRKIGHSAGIFDRIGMLNEFPTDCVGNSLSIPIRSKIPALWPIFRIFLQLSPLDGNRGRPKMSSIQASRRRIPMTHPRLAAIAILSALTLPLALAPDPPPSPHPPRLSV